MHESNCKKHDVLKTSFWDKTFNICFGMQWYSYKSHALIYSILGIRGVLVPAMVPVIAIFVKHYVLQQFYIWQSQIYDNIYAIYLDIIADEVKELSKTILFDNLISGIYSYCSYAVLLIFSDVALEVLTELASMPVINMLYSNMHNKIYSEQGMIAAVRNEKFSGYTEGLNDNIDWFCSQSMVFMNHNVNFLYLVGKALYMGIGSDGSYIIFGALGANMLLSVVLSLIFQGSTKLQSVAHDKSLEINSISYRITSNPIAAFVSGYLPFLRDKTKKKYNKYVANHHGIEAITWTLKESIFDLKAIISGVAPMGLKAYMLLTSIIPEAMSKNISHIVGIIFKSMYHQEKYVKYADALGKNLQVIEEVSFMLSQAAKQQEDFRNKVDISYSQDSLNVKNFQMKIPGGSKIIIKDMKLKPSKVYHLIGANGTGKSTLLRVLMGFYGDGIEVDPADNSKGKARVAMPTEKKDIAFVSTSCINPFIGGEKFLDALYAPKKLSGNGRINFAKKLLKRMTEFGIKGAITNCFNEQQADHDEGKKVDLTPDFLATAVTDSDFGTKLSAGEWKKLMLAVVLAKQSKLIFLDEPLANIQSDCHTADTGAMTVEKIMNILKQYAEDNKATIVIVAHAQLGEGVKKIVYDIPAKQTDGEVRVDGRIVGSISR
jgi:ABC-type Mn2+/Zn2+ transport system ATPase subunit